MWNVQGDDVPSWYVTPSCLESHGIPRLEKAQDLLNVAFTVQVVAATSIDQQLFHLGYGSSGNGSGDLLWVFTQNALTRRRNGTEMGMIVP
jgi:hypothetical protein